ncbi:uracil-DNA glycosylase family protein [Yoonia sp. SS1-5]|uniref:Uracil-DNA glycosylase family protein n=1 Tax=Yoonia rhodophyticola TaxID=3137370 RepID=A0AAN0M9J8_9RHOB
MSPDLGRQIRKDKFGATCYAMWMEDPDLINEINGCRLCADRFAQTATQHRPRPVPWFGQDPAILVAGQAPGMRVHVEGKPFWDRSGDRLRDWMGIDRATFYDRAVVSVLPTAFCFPGYDAKGADLPPPAICWETWHARALDHIGTPGLRLLIGAYAIRRHLGLRGSLSDIVGHWRDHAPGTFVLPHPSWRNTGWLRKHSWFETDLLPALQKAVQDALEVAKQR